MSRWPGRSATFSTNSTAGMPQSSTRSCSAETTRTSPPSPARGGSEVTGNIPRRRLVVPDQLVLFDVQDKVATVTLNRPEKLNATTRPMMAQLEEGFTEIPLRQDISVVILRGAGRTFCAGHDVGEHLPKPPFALGDPLINEQRWVYSSLANYRRWF